MAVKEQSKEHKEKLNLEYSEPSTYELQIEGKLTSLKLSGEIQQGQESQVKIYLDNYLVFDSSNLEKTGLLTGLAIDESTTEPTETEEQTSTDTLSTSPEPTEPAPIQPADKSEQEALGVDSNS